MTSQSSIVAPVSDVALENSISLNDDKAVVLIKTLGFVVESCFWYFYSTWKNQTACVLHTVMLCAKWRALLTLFCIKAAICVHVLSAPLNRFSPSIIRPLFGADILTFDVLTSEQILSYRQNMKEYSRHI